MSFRKSWPIVALLGLSSVIIGYIVSKYVHRVETSRVAEVSVVSQGADASAVFRLVLPDPGGKPEALAQWRGKTLVVNYWATWCAPCREEMPGFSRLHEKLRVKDIQFVGISVDTAPNVIEFQKSTPVSYPLLIGDSGAIDSSVALGNLRQALPFTAIIDRHGGVVAVKLGRYAEADLERKLEELILR